MLVNTIEQVGLNSDESQFFEETLTCCPVCSKYFAVMSHSNYSYKHNNIKGRTRYSCSWSCHQKAKKLLLTLRNPQKQPHLSYI